MRTMANFVRGQNTSHAALFLKGIKSFQEDDLEKECLIKMTPAFNEAKVAQNLKQCRCRTTRTV